MDRRDFLYLEALPGPAGILILRLDVDTSIRPGQRHDVDPQFEILKRMIIEFTYVKDVAAWTVRDDRPVLDSKRARVLVPFPAGEVFAVKQRSKALFRRHQRRERN